MLPLFLFVCFLAVPVVEIYVIIQIGQVVGALPTVALLLLVSFLGAWIVRREGRRAWSALQDTLQTGRMPDRELANAALILIGGTLLLTPGFVSDVFGFIFVLPFTRPGVRAILAAFAKRRLEAHMRAQATSASGAGGTRKAPQTPQAPQAGQRQQPGSTYGYPRVVRGDVVDDERG